MSELVEVEVSEISGDALDWAVAAVVGVKYVRNYIITTERNLIGDLLKSSAVSNYNPSTRWEDGGGLFDEFATSMDYCDGWIVSVVGGSARGATKLEAFCRALVSARFGDAVMIPHCILGDK